MSVKNSLSLKITVSGVRGVAGESLTPRLVTSFAAAFGTYSGEGSILIGTDTRPSRVMVAEAAIAGLLSVGCAPVNLGIVPAPTLQHHVRRTAARGGICVTASHNPEEWNALKFFGEDGIVLRPNQFAELLDLYHQGVYPRVSSAAIPTETTDGTALLAHRQTVLESVDAESIRKRRFRVVIDCCNGAGVETAPEFLRALGCDVVPLFDEPRAPFPRLPEPVPENLGVLCARVREENADLGFALDADADRLALVDERGKPLGEDSTVAIAIRHLLARRPGPVVVSQSTSRMVDEIAEARGCPVERTRVGEIHVVERMLELGAAVGGEGNGGVIVPAINPCRDSLVAMALTLESLASEESSLARLQESLPRWEIVKRKLPYRRPRDVARSVQILRRVYDGEEIDLTDGVQVRWPDRWLHVRGSNTEPILRILAEARERKVAESLVESVLEQLRPTLL